MLDNVVVECGLNKSFEDGSREYNAKIIGFYNREEILYIDLSFGLYDDAFPIGRIDRDRFNFIEANMLEQRNSLNNAFTNMIEIRDDTSVLMNEKYKGKFVNIRLLPRIELEKLINNTRINIENTEDESYHSTQYEGIAQDLLKHWQDCNDKIDNSLTSIETIKFSSYLRLFLPSRFRRGYLNCQQYIKDIVYYDI